MKPIYTRQLSAAVTILFLLVGCSSKQVEPTMDNKVGVVTVLGTTTGAILGGVTGGSIGMLATGATEPIAPLVGLVIGAALGGSVGYGIGQVIEN